MKKLLFIILVTLLFVGCGTTKDDDKKKDEISTISQEVDLLSGYPEEVLPLYKLDNIETMTFSRRENINYAIGKDLYYITYNSKASVDEVSKYYQSLMSEIEGKEEGWFMPTFFGGVVKNQNVNISMSKLDESTNFTHVSLSIGLLKSQYVEKNPYFIDYPNDLVEVLYLTQLQEETYEEDLLSKQVNYRTIYQTDKELDEIMNEYETLYKDKDSFRKEVEEKKKTFYWKDQGLDILLKYEYSGDFKYINITATQALNK